MLSGVAGLLGRDLHDLELGRIAALHMVKVPPPLWPTMKVPAVIKFGWPGRFPGPAYQHS